MPVLFVINDAFVKSPDAALRCIAAYFTVRLIPQALRALPAAFLRRRPDFDFYGSIIRDGCINN
jgi:hypothetical protein